MKFIRLTEVVKSGQLNIIVNAHDIFCISPSNKGSDTHIKMRKEGEFYFVKETIDQIWNMLNIDMTKAPVIMTAQEAVEYHKIKDGVL